MYNLNKLIKNNLCPIPITADKVPTTAWKVYQTRLPWLRETANWQKHQKYFGIVCGSISGNLEVIDFDLKNDPGKTIDKEFSELLAEQGQSKLLKSLVIQLTPSGGWHLIYRCQKIEGNQILAKANDRKPIIETRGEGGYIAISHELGYQIKRGSLLTISTISPDERQVLLDTARKLTRYEEPEVVPIRKEYIRTGTLPGDLYDKQAEPLQLLKKHGWQIVVKRGNKIYLRRPGKSKGSSGTYFVESGIFFCHTSSSRFKPGQYYKPWQVYAVLEHGGNFRQAAKYIINHLFK